MEEDSMDADLQKLKKEILEFCRKYNIEDFRTELITQGRNTNGDIVHEDVVLIVAK